MTMPYWVTVPCALCGTETEITKFLSTHSVGSGDLDMRSAGMHGLILSAQVQRCPGCGYCASDVSVVNPDAQAVISGQEYRDQLNDPANPELVNSFLCKAILDRESKHFSNATWALIKAAWVCDDTDHLSQAKVCRQKAADMLRLAEAHNQNVSDQDGKNVAILVDLLRRSGQENQAREVVAAKRGGIIDDLIKLILYYQIDLFNKKDFSRHTIAEARSRFMQNGPEVVAKSKSQSIADAPKDPIDKAGREPEAQKQEVTVANHSDQFDSNLDEDLDAEVIWEEYQREKGNKSSLINYADHEAIWEEYRQAILDEQRRKEEDESDFYGHTDPNAAWAAYRQEKEKEKFLAHVQKFREVLRKDGVEAAGAYLEREIKAEEEAKKSKARWDEVFKIAGVVLVTAFFIAKCNDSNNQSDCYYEYGKYGAERICE